MADSPDIERIGKRVQRVVVDVIMTLMVRASARTVEHMIVPGGATLKTNTSKLTTRSGRLLRALMAANGPQRGAGGKFVSKGNRESSMEIIHSGGGTILGEWTINVPYAAIHEYGGQMAAYTILMTLKMRSFLWAKFYQTKEAKFRGAALRRGVTMPARTVIARPYIHPAIEATLTEKDSLLSAAIAAEFGATA